MQVSLVRVSIGKAWKLVDIIFELPSAKENSYGAVQGGGLIWVHERIVLARFEDTPLLRLCSMVSTKFPYI